jgi:hypothetical protein
VGTEGVTRTQSFWLFPLPPSRTLRFAAVWPQPDIEETVVTVDADEAIEAAARAVEVRPMPSGSDDEAW